MTALLLLIGCLECVDFSGPIIGYGATGLHGTPQLFGDAAEARTAAEQALIRSDSEPYWTVHFSGIHEWRVSTDMAAVVLELPGQPPAVARDVREALDAELEGL